MPLFTTVEHLIYGWRRIDAYRENDSLFIQNPHQLSVGCNSYQTQTWQDFRVAQFVSDYLNAIAG